MQESGSVPHTIDVTLDGQAIEIPSERRSLSAVRAYLDSIALQKQRVLCTLVVDGEAANLTQPESSARPFARVEAATMCLNEVPIQLVKAAMQQAAASRLRVQAAVEVVLINDAATACELWWSLAVQMKEAVLTLSLIPEHVCGPANGRASLMQLRKWQLQQLACVIQDIDAACGTEDVLSISDALEKRALPWLDNLLDSLNLWSDTILAGTRTQTSHTA